MAVFRDGDRPKDKLPLEHMSLDDDLRFFLEIFYNMEVVNYDCDGFLAGVMLDNQRKLKLGVNLEALDAFPIPEELYILTHEGGHIVFDHLIRGERWVNKQAANIAADAVLNSILNRHYPQIKMPRRDGKIIGLTLEGLYKDGMIKDEDLNLLKKDLKELTTDDVYEIIIKNAPQQGGKGGQQEQQGSQCPNCGNDMNKPPKQGQQGQPQQGQGQPGDGQGECQCDAQTAQGQGKEQGEGEGEGEGQTNQHGQGSKAGKSGGPNSSSQGNHSDGEKGDGDGQGNMPQNGQPGQGPGGSGSQQGQKVTPIQGPGTPSGKGCKITKPAPGQQSGSGKCTCPHCGEEVDAQGGGSGQSVLNGYDKQRIDNHAGVTAEDVDDDTRVQIEELIRQARSGMYGDKAGNFIRDLMDAVKKHFPFQEILDKIIYREKYDFTRENRRLKIPGCFIPRRKNEKIKVYAMVDVSGSCYDYTEDFIGYIMALKEFEEIILIDTQIQMIVKKGDGIPRVVPGGGGTDLNPGFERWKDIEQNTRGYKLNFVCLTDGDIPALQTGPMQSKVVIMTTHEEVYNKNAPRRYMNIHINPEEDQ